jgi:membrane protein DedA with SNARE-associated domain
LGGVVAGQGHIDLGVLLGLTWLCAFSGDVTGYLLGRRLGRPFLLVHGPRVHITAARLVRVEAFFNRYGPAAILIGRFVGLVRAVAPFLAGASRYPVGRFVALSGLGTGLWSVTFVLLGYLFSQSLDEAVALAKHGSLAIGGLVAVVIAVVAGYRYLHGRSRRPRPAELPSETDTSRTDAAGMDDALPGATSRRERGRRASMAAVKVRSAGAG